MHGAVVSTSCPEDYVAYCDKTVKEMLSTREVCMIIQEIKGDI